MKMGKEIQLDSLIKEDLIEEFEKGNVAYLREMLSRKDPHGGRKPPVVALDKPE